MLRRVTGSAEVCGVPSVTRVCTLHRKQSKHPLQESRGMGHTVQTAQTAIARASDVLTDVAGSFSSLQPSNMWYEQNTHLFLQHMMNTGSNMPTQVDQGKQQLHGVKGLTCPNTCLPHEK